MTIGGCWRVHGRSKGRRGVGHHVVQTVLDENSRLVDAEFHNDEKYTTCTGVPTRTAALAPGGKPMIERVPPDNAVAHRRAIAMTDAVAALCAVQKFIKPQCLWTSGKAERFNRTLRTEGAYRRK